jgi:hypothetical protein
MPGKVIHFGPDDCHRLMVLQSAGYTVQDCGSLPQLRLTLESDSAPDAVLMSDGDGVSPQEAIAVARTHSSNPVILFRNTNQSYEDSGFDLVIPCLTPPEVWLTEVDALIEKRRAVLRA